MFYLYFMMVCSIFLIPLFGVPLAAAQRQVRKVRHQTCLQNIKALERELFPEWCEDDIPPEAFDFEIAPGARWLVNDVNAVHVYAQPYTGMADTRGPE